MLLFYSINPLPYARQVSTVQYSQKQKCYVDQDASTQNVKVLFKVNTHTGTEQDHRYMRRACGPWPQNTPYHSAVDWWWL